MESPHDSAYRAPAPSTTSPFVAHRVAASAAAHEASLRRLTSEGDPDAVGLREAVRDALCARLLLGPDAAAAAARVSGFGVSRDVDALAREIALGIGRVTWDVHASYYKALTIGILAEEDEL